MNWFDCLLVAIVGFSGSLALRRGFVREAIGLLGWVVAFVFASHFAGGSARLLSRWAGDGPVVTGDSLRDTGNIVGGVSAFLFLFLAILLAMILIGRLAHSLVGRAGLSLADRVLGLTFGLARGVFVILIGFLVFMLFNVSEPAWMSSSHFAPVCHTGVVHLVQWLPQDFPLLEGLKRDVAAWQQDQRWTPPAPW